MAVEPAGLATTQTNAEIAEAEAELAAMVERRRALEDAQTRAQRLHAEVEEDAAIRAKLASFATLREQLRKEARKNYQERWANLTPGQQLHEIQCIEQENSRAAARVWLSSIPKS